jgi:hypothetical protein
MRPSERRRVRIVELLGRLAAIGAEARTTTHQMVTAELERMRNSRPDPYDMIHLIELGKIVKELEEKNAPPERGQQVAV